MANPQDDVIAQRLANDPTMMALIKQWQASTGSPNEQAILDQITERSRALGAPEPDKYAGSSALGQSFLTDDPNGGDPVFHQGEMGEISGGSHEPYWKTLLKNSPMIFGPALGAAGLDVLAGAGAGAAAGAASGAGAGSSSALPAISSTGALNAATLPGATAATLSGAAAPALASTAPLAALPGATSVAPASMVAPAASAASGGGFWSQLVNRGIPAAAGMADAMSTNREANNDALANEDRLRAIENQFGANNTLNRAELELRQKEDQRRAYNQGLKAALALNAKDVTIDRSQFRSPVANISFANSPRPSQIGEEGRALAEGMNAQALKDVLNEGGGAYQTPAPYTPVEPTERKGASIWENLLGGLSFAGTALNGNRNLGSPHAPVTR